ncbi:MAG TPA: hypothetical protein VFR75_01325 [Solirubrobacterales bacterium]|nr:hypothetical protein [Solirubrobacterales bacterium]
MIQENRNMRKRIASFAATLGATALMLVVLPLAAQAAESPWWQVLTSSRPGNMWESQNQVQELQAGPEFTVVSINGTAVACMYSEFCPGFFGFPNTETALQLEEALEAPAAYGAGNVEVVEAPESSRRFLITSIGEDAGRAAPPLEILLGPGSTAKVVTAAGSGRLVATITNLGDAPVDATTTPVTIVDELPEGVEAAGVEAFAGPRDLSGPVECAVEAADLVSCTFEGTLAPYEAIEIEVPVILVGDPPASGAPGAVTVSGGNAAGASAVQEVKVSPEETPFGIDLFSVRAEEEGGGEATQAGGHPFQLTTTIQLNAGAATVGQRTDLRDLTVEQPAMPRNLSFPLPRGLVGNASLMPQCDMVTFFDIDEAVNKCPDASAIGVASVTVIESANLGYLRLALPIFNLPPAEGEPARFGFVAGGAPVVIDTEVKPEDGYRIVAKVRNTPQVVTLLSSSAVFWGTPGDPRHDSSRGWNCVYAFASGSCERPASLGEDAFLRQPVSCDGPLDFDAELEPWNVPLGSAVESASSSPPGMNNCHKVPFNPAIAASPSSKLAANPSGLSFRLDMPNSGLNNKDGIAEGQPKKVEVSLPKGMTVNPSQGEGLVGCSPAEYGRETVTSLPGEGCPEASKVGTVQVSTPLLEEEARGSLYVASPYDNPSGSLIALYMVARIPERGIVIKQAGKVVADPVTGQLTSTFDNLPQLPFSSFKLEFRPGGRAPLVTPPACGDYDVVARFTPWSAQDPDNPAPNEIVTRTSTFTVERGADGGACPSGGVPPFKPGLLAGTINNAAGRYSPFNIRLTRTDSEQEFTNFSIKLPPGVVGKLAGIPFCSDAAIAAAKARTGPTGGAEELASPSCPAASQVGRTLVGAGVGSVLTYVPGKLYMAGPYNGAPLSIAAITAVKVGPFDLGVVVVRQALRINPETAEVFVDATGSDPIPHIIQGIVTHARDIRVYVDRPEFVKNPTSCERTSTASTVLGSGLDFGSDADNMPVTVTSPFQAADCARLGFKPKLELSLKGKTRRGGNPALKAIMRPRAGDANAARISVALPRSEFLDQSHIRTVCTRVQFRAGAGSGAACPKGAIYGHVRAWTPLLDKPLEGPVFLRSSENPLPDLVLALRGLIDIHAVGRIDSVNGGIRTTFDFVPDAPITKVVLEMGGGKKSLLENSTNICRGKHNATVKMKGHNGAVRNFSTPLKARCGGKAKKPSKGKSKS